MPNKDSRLNLDETAELLDVVNNQDRVIDTIPRRDILSLRTSHTRYIRAVEAFLQRENGDIYLPRRATHKTLFPGGLDLSVAGHVLQGESYTTALVRETVEELGIKLSLNNYWCIKKLTPTPRLFYFRKLYLIHSNHKPRLSTEHTEASWIPLDQLIDYITNDSLTKETLLDDARILIDYLQ